MKSKTYTQSKQPFDKNERSEFCQSNVKQTHFENLKKKKEVIFLITGHFKLRVKSLESLALCTLTGESTVRVGRVDLAVLPMGGPEGHRIQVKDAQVVEHLNVNMSRPQDLSKWEHLKDIPLPKIGGEETTLLIGANIPEAQIQEEVRVGGAGEPYAVRTLLGWAIIGPLNGNIRIQVDKVNVHFLKYGNETLDQQMSQFLGLENIVSISSSRKGMPVQDREA